jgi:hypothetical protein
MDPVFTLPYSEYAVVEKITEYLGVCPRNS